MAVISGSQLPVQVRAAAVHNEHHEHAGRGGGQGRGRLQRGGGGHRGELERDHHQQRREQSDREDEGQEVPQQTPVRRDLPRQAAAHLSTQHSSCHILILHKSPKV